MPAHERVAARSVVGLNAANFFLAELVGVVVPFLADFLKARHWRYDEVGVATALTGLGVFLMQTPAGLLVDRVRRRRALLAAASVLLGICFGLIPLVPPWRWTIDALAFCGGAAQAFFQPLLGALALGLVGHAGLGRMMGVNQAWNHAGNLAAALSALALVDAFGIAAVFYSVAAVSLLASGAAFLIRARDVDAREAAGAPTDDALSLRALFRDRRVAFLFAAVALFHLANAPVMPLVALDLKHLGGSDPQVAGVVLVAQIVMVPVSMLAGRLCDRIGRKPIFAIGFVALPARIFLYSLATSPRALLALQALDGIGAGIYGVVIVAMTADLTEGRGRFNALVGLFATAQAIGGVVGPLGSGLLVQHLGFVAAFDTFALIAAVAAVVFLAFVPETRGQRSRRPPLATAPACPNF
jgi:MFS family permease